MRCLSEPGNAQVAELVAGLVERRRHRRPGRQVLGQQVGVELDPGGVRRVGHLEAATGKDHEPTDPCRHQRRQRFGQQLLVTRRHVEQATGTDRAGIRHGPHLGTGEDPIDTAGGDQDGVEVRTGSLQMAESHCHGALPDQESKGATQCLPRIVEREELGGRRLGPLGRVHRRQSTQDAGEPPDAWIHGDPPGWRPPASVHYRRPTKRCRAGDGGMVTSR